MKRLTIVLMLLFTFCLLGVALADDSTGVAVSPSTIFSSLNGDVVYLPLKHTGATGVTTTLATISGGLFELKVGPMVDFKQNVTATGVLGLSLPKLISILGGTWAPSTFTVDIEAGSSIYFTGKGAIQPNIGGAVIKIPL